MTITQQDLALIIGQQVIEIYALQKQLAEAQKKLATIPDVQPKPDVPVHP